MYSDICEDSLKLILTRLCNDAGFDMETAKMVIEIYLTQSKELIDELKIIFAMDEEDAFIKTQQMMHKLKGSSGNVRANFLMNLAMESEKFAKDGDRESVLKNIFIIEDIISSYILEAENI